MIFNIVDKLHAKNSAFNVIHNIFNIYQCCICNVFIHFKNNCVLSLRYMHVLNSSSDHAVCGSKTAVIKKIQQELQTFINN